MKSLRERLTQLGQSLSVPVVFLKGAWSEPVLYYARGDRLVSDIDVLVPPEQFKRFSRALHALDYERQVPPFNRYTDDRAKEWTLVSSDRAGLTIDLHRGLANPPARLDAHALIARSHYYPSPDGPVLSLCPTDQMAYTAVHYMNHDFVLDGRHLEDTRRLIERYPVDWAWVDSNARQNGFGLGWRWVKAQLGRATLSGSDADKVGRLRTARCRKRASWNTVRHVLTQAYVHGRLEFALSMLGRLVWNGMGDLATRSIEKS